MLGNGWRDENSCTRARKRLEFCGHDVAMLCSWRERARAAGLPEMFASLADMCSLWPGRAERSTSKRRETRSTAPNISRHGCGHAASFTSDRGGKVETNMAPFMPFRVILVIE